MSFTSYAYIAFLAILILFYYRIPKTNQWKLLLLASYIFYATISPAYLLLLVFTTAVTYLAAVKIQELGGGESADL